MQAQDATTIYLFKLWNWVEANRNRVIGGAVVVAAAAFVLWFMVSQREAKEVAAGQALTQAAFSGGYQMADAYAKVAAQYPGTTAGQRALLLNAAALFEAGKFSDAQAQFQKFLDAHPDSEFSSQALLGVATSLDAQGKTDLASGAYQRVINNSSDIAAVSAARFGLARIEESQGKLNDALALYQDVARANPSSVLGSEATMHLIELRNKMPAPAPAPVIAPAPAATAPAVPPKSSQ
jgi:TolA-binding protein